ncbi:MAG: EsaB/YukD family protein [Cyanobacteria bacterium J06635_10]
MNNSLCLIIRSADQTRKAKVELSAQATVEQLIQCIKEQWNLPNDTSYVIRLERTGEQLDSANTLDSAGVEDNDVLEIYPNLEAGYYPLC